MRKTVVEGWVNIGHKSLFWARFERLSKDLPKFYGFFLKLFFCLVREIYLCIRFSRGVVFSLEIQLIECVFSLEGYQFFATVAQLVEQLICNQLVGGSSPSSGS